MFQQRNATTLFVFAAGLVSFFGLASPSWAKDSSSCGKKAGAWSLQKVLSQKAATIKKDLVSAQLQCGRAGAPCQWSSECCEGDCNTNDVCGDGAFCEGNGSKCSFGSDCCSGICNDQDVCSLSESRGCRAMGEACTFSSDCCEGNCNTNDVCGGGAFCEGNGSRCSFDSDCCSNFCNDRTDECG